MKELLTYIANSLVSKPEEILVSELTTESATTLKLKVAGEDMGRIIGRGGRTAKEIRTIIRAANRDKGKVMVDFVD